MSIKYTLNYVKLRKRLIKFSNSLTHISAGHLEIVWEVLTL